MKVGSLLAFLRQLLDMDGLPDYEDVVRRQFERYITQHTYNADQINFLRVVQNVFWQKRKLAQEDLYMPPLTAFGNDAVERLFTMEDVREVGAASRRPVVGDAMTNRAGRPRPYGRLARCDTTRSNIIVVRFVCGGTIILRRARISSRFAYRTVNVCLAKLWTARCI